MLVHAAPIPVADLLKSHVCNNKPRPPEVSISASEIESAEVALKPADLHAAGGAVTISSLVHLFQPIRGGIVMSKCLKLPGLSAFQIRGQKGRNPDGFRSFLPVQLPPSISSSFLLASPPDHRSSRCFGFAVCSAGSGLLRLYE